MTTKNVISSALAGIILSSVSAFAADFSSSREHAMTVELTLSFENDQDPVQVGKSFRKGGTAVFAKSNFTYRLSNAQILQAILEDGQLGDEEESIKGWSLQARSYNGSIEDYYAIKTVNGQQEDWQDLECILELDTSFELESFRENRSSAGNIASRSTVEQSFAEFSFDVDIENDAFDDDIEEITATGLYLGNLSGGFNDADYILESASFNSLVGKAYDDCDDEIALVTGSIRIGPGKLAPPR